MKLHVLVLEQFSKLLVERVYVLGELDDVLDLRPKLPKVPFFIISKKSPIIENRVSSNVQHVRGGKLH